VLAIAPSADILTPEGIERLNTDSSPWMRAQTAATVAVLFVENALSEGERQYAIGILEHLARDLERQVREALSDHLKHSALLPRSIAQTLADDVESVAVPIIRYSSVLDEADLLSIVHTGSEPKQVAVARRENLGAVIAKALAETGNRVVVSALLANETARIEEPSYNTILDRFGADEKIQALMAERPALPAAIIASMILKVSDALRARLIERFNLPESMADELSARAQESALGQSIGPIQNRETMEVLCKRLHARGALSPIYLLRALCTGQLRLFTAGMAVRAGVPASNAAGLIRDGGRRGLMALYVHADMPGGLLSAFRIALDVAMEAEAKGPAPWSEALTRRIVRLLVANDRNIAPGDLDTVLAQLAHRHGESAAAPAGALNEAL
jgi:uncharacterized protein (DUF2336 family)